MNQFGLTLTLAAMLTSPSAARAGADDVPPYDLAISRLRACALSGVAGAPTTSLNDALVAVRSLCRPQLNRVYAASDARIAAGNPDLSGEALDDLRSKARRKIDRKLAILVSTQTGLTQ